MIFCHVGISSSAALTVPALSAAGRAVDCSNPASLGRHSWSHTEQVPKQLSYLISFVEHASSSANSHGVRAVPPSHPQTSPLLTGAHLPGDDLVLRLCQGDISVYFCGGVCEARTERKQVLIKKRELKLGPIPLYLRLGTMLLSSDSPGSDISSHVLVVSAVRGWS